LVLFATDGAALEWTCAARDDDSPHSVSTNSERRWTTARGVLLVFILYPKHAVSRCCTSSFEEVF
jgi:hypothetical protein